MPSRREIIVNKVKRHDQICVSAMIGSNRQRASVERDGFIKSTRLMLRGGEVVQPCQGVAN